MKNMRSDGEDQGDDALNPSILSKEEDRRGGAVAEGSGDE